MFYVYMITNKINDKKYIGKTYNILKRWKKHIKAAESGKNAHLIHRSIKKYGSENFEIKKIDFDLIEKDAYNKEEFWIAFYKTNVVRYGPDYGYNMTDGGDGFKAGVKFTEAHKKALSLARTGLKLSEEVRATLKGKGKGRVTSDAAKQKLSLSKLGDKNPQSILTPEIVLEIKKIYKDNPDTSSQLLAAKYFVAPRTIRDIKNNKTWKHI